MDIREWAVRFSEASDADPAIGAMARYFTCSYLFDMGEAKAIVEMVDGKIYRINISPAPMDPYDFALRASAATWREFARPIPRRRLSARKTRSPNASRASLVENYDRSVESADSDG